jgi:hypothetical protein
MGWFVNATLRPLYPLERPGTRSIGGWVGSSVGLGRVREFSPPPGPDPRTVQLVSSHYNDWAILDLNMTSTLEKFLY